MLHDDFLLVGEMIVAPVVGGLGEVLCQHGEEQESHGGDEGCGGASSHVVGVVVVVVVIVWCWWWLLWWLCGELCVCGRSVLCECIWRRIDTFPKYHDMEDSFLSVSRGQDWVRSLSHA